jgi:hypothetical protein
VTFERSPGPPTEAHQPLLTADPVIGSAAPSGSPTPVQIRLQILSTEHWSLLSSRGLAWNENFTRVSMYLSTLSFAVVSLGLIAGVDKFSDVFFVFALVILPVVLFVGIATFLRMGSANYHDALAVIGMNRIRGAYLEIAPELEPYFVMGVHDDPVGVIRTMGIPPGMRPFIHVVSAAPFVVNVLNGVVGGAIVAIVAVRILGLELWPTLFAGIVGFAIVLGVQLWYVRSNIRVLMGGIRPMFPTPPDEPGA